MRIHILSDLHNEFEPYSPADVKADVVVLAGDIHSRGRSTQWALAHFDGPIVLVAGNHEYYRAISEMVETMLRAAAAWSGGSLPSQRSDRTRVDGVSCDDTPKWAAHTLGECQRQP